MNRKNKEKTNKKLPSALLFLIVAFILIILAVYGLSPASDRSVEDYKLDDTYVYTGEMNEKYFDGQGKLQDEKGNIYQGSFSDGKFSGKGKFSSAEGWSYEGYFDKGHADGAATLKGKYFEWTTEDGKSWTFEGSDQTKDQENK